MAAATAALASWDDGPAGHGCDHFQPADAMNGYMYRAALSGPLRSGVTWLGETFTGVEWLGEMISRPGHLDLDAVVHVDGWTMLTLASSLGHHQLVELLLDCGADTEKRGASGMVAMGWACFNGHKECVRILLERGANLHCCNPGGVCRAGLTSLVVAAKRGQIPCMALLLAFGAGHAAGQGSDRCAAATPFPLNNFSAPVVALLSATANQPALHTAIACRCPADARSALKLGRIDIAGCSPATMRKLATSTSPLGLGLKLGVEACIATTELIKLSMAPWSPANHMLHHRNFRDHVGVVLLAEHRLKTACNGGSRRSVRRGALPVLPALMWSAVLSFLFRSDWPVDPLTRRP